MNNYNWNYIQGHPKETKRLFLTAEKLVELYLLRFQIEFNFRDAK